MNFLDKFPKIPYDINKSGFSNYENITDLTFRFSFIKSVLDNTSAYYEYTIRDGETPEILSDRVYNDPEAYWMILYANDIYDPQYDWPMNDDVFAKYIIGKYGSIEAAKSTIHHYEKVVTRQVGNSQTIYTDRQIVDFNAKTTLVCTLNTATSNAATIFNGEVAVQNDPDDGTTFFNAYILSYDTTTQKISLQLNYGKVRNYVQLFVPSTSESLGIVIDNNQSNQEYFENLPIDPVYSSYIVNNKTVSESVSRVEVSNYDYELEQNESKRLIKVIKREYYGQIQNEFDRLTNTNPSFIRRLT